MAARTVRTINSLEPQAAAMRREDFLQKTKEFSKRLRSGETKEDILTEAYALCREAAKRTLGKRPYDVQMMGSVVLNFTVIEWRRKQDMRNLHDMHSNFYIMEIKEEKSHDIRNNFCIMEAEGEKHHDIW